MTGTLPHVLNSALWGDNCTIVGFSPLASGDLTITLILPLTRTFHRNLSRPRNLNLNLICTIAWAINSALEGGYESGVALALVRSLDRNLTLLNAFSPWVPIPKSENTMPLGSRSGAESLSMEHATTPCRLPGPMQLSKTIPEVYTNGDHTVVCLRCQRLILTGNLPRALNSAILGDHCTSVGSAPGDSWVLTQTLTLPLTGTLH